MRSILNKCKISNFILKTQLNIKSWLMESLNKTEMRLTVESGIEWINKPNFMIAGFIENSIAASQVKMGKDLRAVYGLNWSTL